MTITLKAADAAKKTQMVSIGEGFPLVKMSVPYINEKGERVLPGPMYDALELAVMEFGEGMVGSGACLGLTPDSCWCIHGAALMTVEHPNHPCPISRGLMDVGLGVLASDNAVNGTHQTRVPWAEYVKLPGIRLVRGA